MVGQVTWPDWCNLASGVMQRNKESNQEVLLLCVLAAILGTSTFCVPASLAVGAGSSVGSSTWLWATVWEISSKASQDLACPVVWGSEGRSGHIYHVAGCWQQAEKSTSRCDENARAPCCRRAGATQVDTGVSPRPMRVCIFAWYI